MEVGVRKGAWSSEEDILLRDCIHKYGEGKWHLVPVRAGLNRCRKSCRLRWLNYLKPDIKRGYFGNDEIDLIVRLHKLLGNRWSLIAGRLPGRTANDVKNFWNTHISKKPPSAGETDRGKTITITRSNIARPRPWTFSNSQTPAWSSQLTTSNSSAALIKHHRGEDPSTKTQQQLPFSSAAPLSVENIVDQTDSYQVGEDALLPEDLDDCLRWWGDLLQETENGQETTPFSFPNGDHGSSSTANNDGLCGSSSVLGVDLEFEQYL